jgi:hypothetical protein
VSGGASFRFDTDRAAKFGVTLGADLRRSARIRYSCEYNRTNEARLPLTPG